MRCPYCNSSNLHICGKRNALYPIGLVAIIGLPFSLLHQASSPIDYKCKECGVGFQHRTITAKIARGVLVLLVSGIVLLIGVLVFAILNGLIS